MAVLNIMRVGRALGTGQRAEALVYLGGQLVGASLVPFAALFEEAVGGRLHGAESEHLLFGIRKGESPRRRRRRRPTRTPHPSLKTVPQRHCQMNARRRAPATLPPSSYSGYAAEKAPKAVVWSSDSSVVWKPVSKHI
ncbi:hypothetical protein DL766_000915 [Monosporascus sp. MC13-8B]|uniref:Uncharacterized protein n=1 Tax=Monosporascus cannonballus TaxID=155416 RepID=A0ABY0HF65_9PEZI|nr:hypothetical protein DL762_003301 [Monosporascus cannonballus]RYP00755.1 hypothetical protein DL763_000635 [Monosporascus cannonballus]RYP38498.1 hypothetical protein DL766_000915 [Monosporascus sp. MC13-8B]